jgi:hypothetical protein
MRLLVLLIALLTTTACTAPAPLAPSPGPWQFSGTVSALNGAETGGPIAGAELTVIDGINLNARVTSDAAGRYVFTGLESGRFTVSIAASGFVGVVPVVDLYRDIEVNFALKPQ